MDPLCGSGHCLFLYSIFGGSKNWRSVDLVHGRESMEGVHGPGSMLCTFAQGCLGRSFWLVVSTCPEVIFSWNFKHLLLTVGVLVRKGTKRSSSPWFMGARCRYTVMYLKPICMCNLWGTNPLYVYKCCSNWCNQTVYMKQLSNHTSKSKLIVF